VKSLRLYSSGVAWQDPVELGTLLCDAAAEGDLHRIQVLVANGADINQGDYDSRTALHIATCFNKLEIVPYLVSVPSININPLDRFCNTPLDDARREGLPAMASILQVHGGVSGRDATLSAQVGNADR
jgi:glutaminase